MISPEALCDAEAVEAIEAAEAVEAVEAVEAIEAAIEFSAAASESEMP